MKRKELIDLKSKEIKDLAKLAREKSHEAKKAKMEILAGKSKNLKVFKNLRRDIAQILTVVGEKQIMEKLQAKKEVKK